MDDQADRTVIQPTSSKPDRGKTPDLENVAPPAEAAETVFSRANLEALWGGCTRDAKILAPEVTLKSVDMNPGRLSSRVAIREQTLVPRGKTIVPPPHYEILRALGEGGMGMVYQARQTSVDRTIALKMLKPEMARDPVSRENFLSEAVTTADLDHPNIVPVHDLGSNADGILFFAMKEIKGTSWQSSIGQKNLDENMEVLMRVADAIAFAHSKGVIHRDLKPANVMLGSFGEVLVVDWGVAASVTKDGKAPALAGDTTVGGTPAYMAPEMARGEGDRIGVCSDIYLLGALLYEILTARPPHAGKTVMDCLEAAAANRIEPTTAGGELLAIALKAMATDPDARYASVKDFQAAIREFQMHAESRALSSRAQEMLEKAVVRGLYDDYAQAVFGFREALALWADNAPALAGQSAACLAYARCAVAKSDLDLAASLLDPEDAAHSALAAQVEKARTERDTRERRVRAMKRFSMAAAGTVVLILAVSTILIRHEQKQTEVQRNLAEARAGQLAEENYFTAIGLAESRVREDRYGDASEILDRCPKERRGWEWHYLNHRCHPEAAMWQMSQHVAPLAMWYDESGRPLVATMASNTLTVWDIRRQEQILTLERNQASTNTPARTLWRPQPLSPDHKRIGWPTPDRNIEIWDLAEKKRLCEVKMEAGRYFTVAFAPDGASLATVTADDDRVRFWDVETGRLRATHATGASNGIMSIAFAPDGKTYAITHDGLQIRDVRTGERLARFNSGGAYCVTYDPSGEHLVTGVRDTLQSFRVSTSLRDVAYVGHTGELVCMAAFSRDGDLVACGSADRTANLWEAKTGRLLARLPHESSVGALAFSPDGEELATISGDKVVKLWRVRPTHPPMRTIGESAWKSSAAADPTGKYLAFFIGERLVLWDISLAKVAHTFPALGAPIAFSPDGTRLAAEFSTDGKRYRMSDAARGTAVLDVRHTNELYRFETCVERWPGSGRAFSSDGKQLAAVQDGVIQLYDAADGRPTAKLPASAQIIVFSPDGRMLLASAGSQIGIWDIETQAVVGELPQPRETRVSVVVFNPSGDRLLTGNEVGRLLLWDFKSRTVIRSFMGLDQIRCAAFHPKEDRIVAAGENGRIVMWDSNSGRTVLELSGTRHFVTGLAFTPSGRQLLAITTRADLWDAGPNYIPPSGPDGASRK